MLRCEYILCSEAIFIAHVSKRRVHHYPARFAGDGAMVEVIQNALDVFKSGFLKGTNSDTTAE